MATKAYSFKSPSSTVHVKLHRNARTGNWMADKIVSKAGKVLVKAGPVTGGKSRPVIKPRGESKLKPSQLSEIIDHMKLRA